MNANSLVLLIGNFVQSIASLFWRFARVPMMLLLRVPVVFRLVEMITRAGVLVPVKKLLDRVYKDSPSPLMRGDLEAVALQRYPKNKFPYLWKPVTESILQHLIVDGRLVSGEDPAIVFAPAAIDDRTVSDALARSIVVGIAVVLVGLLAWNPVSYFGPSAGQLKSTQFFSAHEINLTPKADAWEDVRSEIVKDETLERRKSIAEIKNKVVSGYVLVANSGGYLTALLLGLLGAWAAFRGLLSSVMAHAVDPLRQLTRESGERWKYRQEQRDLANRLYIDQINAVEWDDQPLIKLGRATGTMLFRGALGAPRQNQLMEITLNDANQGGILVTGGTGGGKTRIGLLPILLQLFGLRRSFNQANNPRGLSFYITDGKAVLWKDVIKLAQKVGLMKDVRVIGTGPGEYGVNLIDGLHPRIWAAMLNGIMRQQGGGQGNDKHWSDLAAYVCQQIGTVLYAWARTKGGLKHAQTHGEDPHSFTWVLYASYSDDFLLQAMKEVSAAIKDPDEFRAVAHRVDASTSDAIDYLVDGWLCMADVTKSGVRTNITNALANFAADPLLRKQFASGGAEKIMKISDVWGSITLVNLSFLEHGVGAIIANVFLKNLFMREAERRQRDDEKIGDREKCVFMADEYQTLVTASKGSMNASKADDEFWNVSRSTGVLGILATQSKAALTQALGEEVTANFLSQMRNRIMFPVDDPETTAWMEEMCGKSMRFRTYERDQYESYEAMVREIGFDPVDVQPYQLNTEAMLTDFVLGPISGGGMRSPVELDTRFVYRSMSNPDAGITSMKEAVWRQEDKHKEALREGTEIESCFHKEDVTLLGRAHALMWLQRGGKVVFDVVDIAELRDFQLDGVVSE